MPRPVPRQAVTTWSDKLELRVLWKFILLGWLLVIRMEQKYELASNSQQLGRNMEEVIVKFDEIKLFFLSEVWLISFSLVNLFLWLLLFWLSDSNFLRTSSHSIRWITHYSIVNGSHWYTWCKLLTVELNYAHIHHHYIGAGQFVVQKVRENVELSNLV